ncbi:unnamed protein product [Trifolium pratense]|uniref:Uncharacterized protein n=1 Tax=Trifolium pratense TaxID=57577 RepID=A0ACB0KSB8_TRIPR|nr:unnamed protein product [Trifolium pratense]
MLNEMMNSGFEPNILVLTSLAGCYGKEKQTDDVVRILNQFLYVVTQIRKQEHGKITDCIEKGNQKLGFVVRYLMEERDGNENCRKEASELFNSIEDKLIKTSLWNHLIDLCVNLEVPNRTCDLLNLGLTLDIYTNMQNRSPTMWSLSVKRLSGEELPPVLGIYTGNENSLLSVIEPYLIEHNAPFQKNNDMAGRFDKTSEAVKSWLQSRGSSDI